MAWDVVVIGAGAAGMMCAATAAARGRRVLVLDAASAPGEKIRISGGGRCNFTNRHAAPAQFLSGNPHFCISALSRFTPDDFVALVNRHGIAWHEKTLGQLFCDGSATQIVDMLLAEMKAAGAQLRLETCVQQVDRTGEGIRLHLSGGEAVDCGALVVATGGLSIPKMGATDFGYRLARQFGLRLVPTRAGLVPLTFTGETLERMRALSGTALDVRIRCGKTVFEEALLFTHRGLSGPAILQISSYWREGEEIAIDLAPGTDMLQVLRAARAENGKPSAHTVLGHHLPRRLAKDLADNSEYAGPLGGVDTRDLDSRTLQARAVPGLYFIGEVVDVTGWLGGYNFQWAWSSGWCAGQAV